jgi:histidyl-tRNA synthetase
VDIALKDQSLGKALKRAGQSGARVAVVLGSSERETGELTVRDLASGEERKMTVEALAARLVEGPE